MSNKRGERDQVYAITSWDGFQGPAARPEALVTVKEIVHSLELAEWRVARLNGLGEGKDVRYWWQTTRLVPSGQSAGGNVASPRSRADRWLAFARRGRSPRALCGYNNWLSGADQSDERKRDDGHGSKQPARRGAELCRVSRRTAGCSADRADWLAAHRPPLPERCRPAPLRQRRHPSRPAGGHRPEAPGAAPHAKPVGGRRA